MRVCFSSILSVVVGNSFSSCLAAAMSVPKFVYGKDDALFGCIETQQGDVSFGNVLDAGTGLHSLRWIATLGDKGMTHFTAITADETMRQRCQQEIEKLGVSPIGQVLIANWFDDNNLQQQLEQQQQYDVILADYLIGAMDGFSPYHQDLILAKLCQYYLKPNGRLYIVGLQPIPDSAPGHANIICQVTKVRDACILLAGHRCYREYPVDWVHRQLKAVPNMQLLQTSRFPILYRHDTICKQIQVGRSKFPHFPTPELADAMAKVLDNLEQQSQQATMESPAGKISLGFDYIVSAEKLDPDL